MKITFIGAGNVATHLGLAFKDAGIQINEIYSRTQESASCLARSLNSKFTTEIEKIGHDVDLFIISVSDIAVNEVVTKLKPGNILTVHTSGSLSVDVFKNYALNYGVMYPLQTFSKSIPVDLKQVPFCIEANSPENEKLITNLVKTISEKQFLVNSTQRKYIHLAAVFSCNFANHLFAIAHKILKNQNIPYEIIHPLMIETLEKAINNNPVDVQTGPALRGDENILTLQKDLLGDYPKIQEIYTILSTHIRRMDHLLD